MATLPAESIDAIVTDPPYGLSFMGKDWDHGVPGVAFWVEALRVLKPGGHLLAFGGTRTYHRLAVAIEDAGFEIRDCLQWLYGSGFPKSLDVSMAIDNQLGAERKVVTEKRKDMFEEYELPQRKTGTRGADGTGQENAMPGKATGVKQTKILLSITAPATDAAKAWHGWGTALKPSWEPIVMARKPLRGTVADNVLAWGTGALNIDGCRIDANGEVYERRGLTPRVRGYHGISSEDKIYSNPQSNLGRWPANTLLDEEAAAMVDEQSGVSRSSKALYDDMRIRAYNERLKQAPGNRKPENTYSDTGGASRFFYVAKASATERHAGVEDGNNHPTLKPIALMRYLVRMVTSSGGVVCDPFMGSGTTGCAAVLEGFDFVGIDITPEYVEIAERRIAYWGRQPRLI
jgi:DNA modification methylase